MRPMTSIIQFIEKHDKCSNKLSPFFQEARSYQGKKMLLQQHQQEQNKMETDLKDCAQRLCSFFGNTSLKKSLRDSQIDEGKPTIWPTY